MIVPVLGVMHPSDDLSLNAGPLSSSILARISHSHVGEEERLYSASGVQAGIESLFPNVFPSHPSHSYLLSGYNAKAVDDFAGVLGEVATGLKFVLLSAAIKGPLYHPNRTVGYSMMQLAVPTTTVKVMIGHTISSMTP